MEEEKKDKQERLHDGDELNSTFSSRFQGLEIDDTGIYITLFFVISDVLI